jgi:hypothetical protein
VDAAQVAQLDEPRRTREATTRNDMCSFRALLLFCGLLPACTGQDRAGIPAPVADAAPQTDMVVTTPGRADAEPEAMPGDAAPPTPIADAGIVADAHVGLDAASPEAAPPTAAFGCTLVLGTNQTAEWYEAGFEKLVDDSRWELIHAHSAFVELWADPEDPVWSGAIESPCAQNAKTPDRIIFLALAGGPNGGLSNYPLAKWLPLLTADVANIRSRYPGVKRIELMSYVRGPGNGTCPGAPEHRTVVYPSQDQAMAMIAAANPGLVFVAPAWEARSCADFIENAPHPTPTAAMAWAEMIAAHYNRAP